MASDFKYSSQRYNRDGYNRIVDLTGTAVLKYRKSGTSQITLKVDGTLDVEKILSPVPDKAAIIAPTIITEEIAFVTDINGVCNDGVTLHTT